MYKSHPSPFEHGLFRPLFAQHPYMPPVSRAFSAAPAQFMVNQAVAPAPAPAPVRFQSCPRPAPAPGTAAPVVVSSSGPVRRRVVVSDRIYVSSSSAMPVLPATGGRLQTVQELQVSQPSVCTFKQPVFVSYDRFQARPQGARIASTPPFKLMTPQLKCPMFPLRAQFFHQLGGAGGGQTSFTAPSRGGPAAESPLLGGDLRNMTPVPHMASVQQQHQRRISEAAFKKASEEWIFNKSVGERVARMEDSLKENLRRNGSAYFFRVENY